MSNIIPIPTYIFVAKESGTIITETSYLLSEGPSQLDYFKQMITDAKEDEGKQQCAIEELGLKKGDSTHNNMVRPGIMRFDLLSPITEKPQLLSSCSLINDAFHSYRENKHNLCLFTFKPKESDSPYTVIAGNHNNIYFHTTKNYTLDHIGFANPGDTMALLEPGKEIRQYLFEDNREMYDSLLNARPFGKSGFATAYIPK